MAKMTVKNFLFLDLKYAPVQLPYVLRVHVFVVHVVHVHVVFLNTSTCIWSLRSPVLSMRCSSWSVTLAWTVWPTQPERLFSSEDCTVCLLSDAAGAFQMLLLPSLTTLACQML